MELTSLTLVKNAMLKSTWKMCYHISHWEHNLIWLKVSIFEFHVREMIKQVYRRKIVKWTKKRSSMKVFDICIWWADQISKQHKQIEFIFPMYNLQFTIYNVHHTRLNWNEMKPELNIWIFSKTWTLISIEIKNVHIFCFELMQFKGNYKIYCTK